MNATNTNERKDENTARKGKALNILTKIFLYTVIAVVVVFALVALYQILEFLFVAAVLIIAWICPKRWW
jgi:cell division protein FtsL